MHEESPSAAYPMVRLLVARGKGFAFLLCAIVLLGCAGAGVALGQLWLMPAGIVASAVLLGLLLSYVEVLRIIADTLIPKY